MTYSSSNTGVATITGGQIHIVGAGTTTITASQPGNSSYKAATPVEQTLTVNKANQTITFTAIPAITTGTADFNPGATASSGLAVTYTSSNANVATIVGGMIHIVGAGTTNITASQPGNSNYAAAQDVIQTLTVNQTTAVIDLNADDVMVYPIPANNQISIKIPADKVALIQMISTSGQVVITKKQETTVDIIDVSALVKGFYTIKLTLKDTVITKKAEIR